MRTMDTTTLHTQETKIRSHIIYLEKPNVYVYDVGNGLRTSSRKKLRLERYRFNVRIVICKTQVLRNIREFTQRRTHCHVWIQGMALLPRSCI
ncbi:hypothetical protein GDO81_020267 [Engystomops pustulosus]|uniref:Uncharacterized protein n=1 Tax=Engystomops pustulosus TaxID=76066 RepID=A0AAV6ZQS0_ENGPU|nr:hypothetical protein GDO81_020267 [Engystomops pustulosus]